MAEQITDRWLSSAQLEHLPQQCHILAIKGTLRASQGHHDNIELFEQALSKSTIDSDTIRLRHDKVLVMIDNAQVNNSTIEQELISLTDCSTIRDACLTILDDTQDQSLHRIFLHYLYFRSPTSLIDLYIHNIELWNKAHSTNPWFKHWLDLYRGLLLIDYGHSEYSTWIKNALDTYQSGLFKLQESNRSMSGLNWAMHITHLYIAYQNNIMWNDNKITKTTVIEALTYHEKQW